MTLASFKDQSFPYEINEDSPREVIQMFIRRPEIIDIFYNIKAGTFEGLMVDDEHAYLTNRPEAFDLEFTYLPFLVHYGLIRKADDYPNGKIRYFTNYTDILVNPNIGRSEFTHMVLQRSNIFQKSLPEAHPDESIAAIIVGTDSQDDAKQMLKEFKELATKWHNKFARVSTRDVNQSRFTLTILGESTCIRD